MSLFMKILRDPIWQAIGALIGVIAIFVSISTTPPSGGELAIVHFKKIKFTEYWLPADRIKLLVQGYKQELNDATVDYFIIYNKTTKPILTTDYTKALEIQKGKNTKKILVVESCSKPLAQKCSSDGASTPSGATYVAFDWTTKGDRWVATPSLLNPGDQSCVLVVSQDSGNPSTNTSERLGWDARIASIQLKVYGSPEDFSTNQKKNWTDQLETTVILSGTGAYWFILLQSTLFLITTFLSAQSGWIASLKFSNLLRLVLVAALATSTSEILVDIFINHHGESLHFIAIPLVVAHGLLVLYFVYRALNNQSKGSETFDSETK